MFTFTPFSSPRLSKPQRKRKSAASSSSADLTNHSGGGGNAGCSGHSGRDWAGAINVHTDDDAEEAENNATRRSRLN